MEELQRIFYNELPDEKYNPNDFLFHITLHIDKDEEKVLEMRRIISDNFKPFSVEFNRLGLFHYPGNLIKEFNFSNNETF